MTVIEKTVDPEHHDRLMRCALSYSEGAYGHMIPWNAWCAEQKRHDPSFRVYLNGAHFCNLHLEHANFDDAYLIGTDFRYAHLENASFLSAELKYANFQRADLSFAHFQHVSAPETTFISSNLFHAELNHGNFESANFNFCCLKKSDLSGASMKNARFLAAELQDAKLACSFIEARLDRADLTNSDCTLANFSHALLFRAKLNNVTFFQADISNSNAIEAVISGAEFMRTDLRGANFSYAIVDGLTSVRYCKIDPNTLFRGVGLSSARFQPSIQIGLEANIRRAEWEEWYDRKYSSLRDVFSPYPQTWYFRYMVPEKNRLNNSDGMFEYLYACLFGEYRGIGKISIFGRLCASISFVYAKATNAIVRMFWWLSNYGGSTGRIIWSFIILCFSYCIIYMTGAVNLSGLTTFGIERFVQTIHFATSTMVTLGFGGMNVMPVVGSLFWTWFGYTVVTANLLTGYVLLAALVTRLGILFQQPGPGK